MVARPRARVPAGKAGADRPGRSERVGHRRSPRTLSQFETYCAILGTALQFERQLVELLKTADLTGSQYNVLRVLRGAGAEGLTCGEIGSRLIRHDPDVTRLVDRLERRGLMARSRETRDRRVVRSWITDKGLDVLAELDVPIDTLHERQLGHMDEPHLASLTRLLKEAAGNDG